MSRNLYYLDRIYRILRIFFNIWVQCDRFKASPQSSDQMVLRSAALEERPDARGAPLLRSVGLEERYARGITPGTI